METNTHKYKRMTLSSFTNINRESILIALCIVAITAIYVRFITGYIVFRGDHTQYLLLPFRELFSNFCPNDWLVWHTSHYHYIFSEIIQFLYHVSGKNLEIALLLTWGIFILGFFHALYMTVRALGADFKVYTIVILFLALYTDISLGGTPAYGRYLIPSFMATIVTLYAFSFLLMKKHFTAIIVLACATLIHVNYGVLGIPLFLIYLAFNRQDINRRLLTTALILFVLITLPTTIPTLLSFGDTADKGLWLVYYIRSPHHYNPLAFGLMPWTFTLVPLLIASFYTFRISHNRMHRILLGIMGAFLLFFFITTAIDGPYIFKKIYPFRFSIYALIFSYIIVAQALSTQTSKRKFVILALLIGLVLASATKGFSLVILLRHLLLIIAIITIHSSKKFITRSKLSPLIYTGLLALFLILGSGLQRKTATLPSVASSSVFYREDLTEWIKDNLPPDAMLLTPPDIIGLRLNTHRSVVVNFKGAPIANGQEMLEWKQRLENVTCSPALEEIVAKKDARPLRYELTEYYLRTTPLQVRTNMIKYGATFFLTYNRHLHLKMFESHGFVKRYQDTSISIYEYTLQKYTGEIQNASPTN